MISMTFTGPLLFHTGSNSCSACRQCALTAQAKVGVSYAGHLVTLLSREGRSR
jgi:hypothetical protein